MPEVTENFENTIKNLRLRATRAKRKAFLISMLVGISSLFIIAILITGLLYRSEIIPEPSSLTTSKNIAVSGSSKGLLSETMNVDMNGDLSQKIDTTTPTAIHMLEKILGLAVEGKIPSKDVNNYVDAFSSAINKTEDKTAIMIVSGIFSAGAIGLAIMIIQISTSTTSLIN